MNFHASPHRLIIFRSHSLARQNGAQIQPVQKGALEIPLEVEEKEDSSLAKEEAQDASAFQVNTEYGDVSSLLNPTSPKGCQGRTILMSGTRCEL